MIELDDSFVERFDSMYDMDWMINRSSCYGLHDMDCMAWTGCLIGLHVMDCVINWNT